MKPKSIVTCVPTQNLGKALTFYSQGFKLEGLEIEDGILTIELANLSLFVVIQETYEQYRKRLVYVPDIHKIACSVCTLVPLTTLQ